MTTTSLTNERGITLIEILFATMILSVGLISIVALFPLGVQMHQQSIKDEKSALIVQSLKDAITVACKYASYDPVNNETTIVIVHDGFGPLDTYGVPNGKSEPPILLPIHADMPRVSGKERADVMNPNGTNPPSGIDIKFVDNEFQPYKGGQLGSPNEDADALPLGQLLLKDSPDNGYYNRRDDYWAYSFDIQVREAITVRRPRPPAGAEETRYDVKIYRLASADDEGNVTHDEYEFVIRVYQHWRPRTGEDIAAGRENRQLIRVYSFVASVSR